MMKTIRKLNITILAAVLLLTPLLVALNPKVANAQGQIERGNIFRVKNVTKSTGFTDPVNADPCDSLRYRLRLHNPGEDPIQNVTVKIALSNEVSTKHTATATITADNANPATVSDTAIVDISSAQRINYVEGSARLLDTNGNLIRALSDSLVAGGVNIGELGVSLENIRYVEFDAKVQCPQPPQEQPPEQPEQPAPTKPQEQPPTRPAGAPAAPVPAVLPEAGAGDVVAIFIGVTSLSTVAYYILARRFGIGV